MKEKKTYNLEELKEIVANSVNPLTISQLVQLIQCDTKREFNKLLKQFLKIKTI